MKWYRVILVCVACLIMTICLVIIGIIRSVDYRARDVASVADEPWMNISRIPYVMLHSKVGTGSGFLCRYAGTIFIMTARHVVDDGNGGLLKLVDILDSRGEKIGYAVPWRDDPYRDIALCLATGEAYAHLTGQPLEIADMSVDELKGLIGLDAWYHGAAPVGDWLCINRLGICGFSERVTIVRVSETKHNITKLLSMYGNAELGDDTKDVILITVKGGVWYGCSGGPLLYDGKVIGVCSMVENMTPKAGGVYIYPKQTLIEVFGE